MNQERGRRNKSSNSEVKSLKEEGFMDSKIKEALQLQSNQQKYRFHSFVKLIQISGLKMLCFLKKKRKTAITSFYFPY